METRKTTQTDLSFLLIPLSAGILFYLSRANYLLFHSLTETFCVVISGGIAMVAWNSRHLMQRHFLLFIGLAYPFIALISVLHTFAYKGLSVFNESQGANLPTQLWIAARYLESCTFLIAPYFLERRLRSGIVLSAYALITTLLLASIFVWPIFPACYVDGEGLTSFKVTSEYLISAILLLVMAYLISHRDKFDNLVLRQLLLAVGCNILAELSFTLYVDVFGLLNFSGHFLRLIGVYFLYRAIIEKSLAAPYRSLFRELHQSEQRFRTIYETAPLAFVLWDEKCRVTQWNDAAARMFGWSKEEVLGNDFFEFLIPDSDRPQVEEIIAALRRGTLANRSVNQNLTKSGRLITCVWNNSIFRDQEGRITEVLSLGLDITEQKKAEEKLRHQSEMIKRFAYSVVHDLKSPAGSLAGLADLFNRKYGDNLDDRGKMFCDQIKQVSLQISSLVGDINSYIIAKELPLQIEKSDLRLIFRQLHEEFSSRLEERQLTWVEPDYAPDIRVDRKCLHRILRNLIDNALKYGGQSLTSIEIGYRETPEHHEILVRDDGVGLPPEAEKEIFRIFQRGQTAVGTSGAGLGLAITRELAEKMGGQVRTERNVSHGALFVVSVSRKI